MTASDPPAWAADRDHGPEIDWIDYGRALARGRWLILGALAIALALGAGLALFTPPTYTAETTLEIDRESPKVSPVSDSAPVVSLLSADEFYQTQYGLLRGRAIAERVAQTLGLAADERFLDRMGWTPALLAAPPDGPHRLEEVIRVLRRRLSVSPIRGSRLVEISFASPDPDLSARIAGAFASAFIDTGLDRRAAAARYTRAFLDTQLGAAKASLETTERGLADYATAEDLMMLPGPAAGRTLTAASLESLNTALDGATADRIAAEQRWRQGVAAGAAAPEVLASPTVQQLSQDRDRLAADYQDRLSLFKPDYPDMRQLRARMDETDQALAREAAAIIRSLRTRYDAALGAERALADQVGALRARMVELRARGVGYDIRSREVDSDRAIYEGLLQRLQDVGLAGGTAPENVIVVDPATPPDRPSWPRPWLIMALAGLGGLAAGSGLALVRGGGSGPGTGAAAGPTLDSPQRRSAGARGSTS